MLISLRVRKYKYLPRLDDAVITWWKHEEIAAWITKPNQQNKLSGSLSYILVISHLHSH